MSFLRWNFWFRPFCVKKSREHCLLVTGEKNHFPACHTSRKPSASLRTLWRDHLFPHPTPEVFPQGLAQGLLSTKHNTNVCFVHFSSSAPIYFCKNTQIPVAFLLSPFSPLSSCIPCLFLQLSRVTLANLNSTNIFPFYCLFVCL